MKFLTRLQTFLAALMMASLLALVPNVAPAQVDRELDEEVYRENTAINAMFHKLGRGIVNVLTGWVEVPKNIAEEWRKTDPFTGTIIGFLEGFAWGVARTFAGFYEIISFPFPVPRDYKPVMEPEFILPTVWGERLPIFRDEFVGTGNSVDAAVDYNTMAPPANREGLSREY